MFGFFKKKKEKNYFCADCEEQFDDKYLKARNFTTLKCPFCGSIKCYTVTKKDNKTE